MSSLRIENLLLNNLSKGNFENLFKEGSIFKAEILEVLDDLILIDIKGQGIIKTSSDVNIESLVGEEVSFLVKSNENGKIQLKPLIKEAAENLPLQDKPDNPISKILNTFNIKENEISIDLVESLMKYNVPITEENLLEAIKVLEKLLDLTSLNEEDKVVLFEKENIIENKAIKNSNVVERESSEVVDPKKSVENKVVNLSKENENINLVEKTNVKNLIILDKDAYPEKEDLSNLIKDFLSSGINLEDKDLNKILGFFIKNEIKASLSNFKNFKELAENPIEFSKDFAKLRELLNELKGKTNFNKLKELPVNIELNRDSVEEGNKNIKEIQNILEKSDIKSELSSNIKKEINELENKLDFLKEMDQDLFLLFVPINYGEKQLDGVLTFLKENKDKKNKEENLNIFINLNTKNLGNIKISCQAKLESLSIKINIKESDLKLFESTKQILIDRIQSIGYNVEKIEFIIDRDIDLMDTIISNPDPTYFLDIKV